jgi:hypothetical protein
MFVRVRRAVLRVAVGVAQTLRATGQARANTIPRNRSVIVVIHSLNRSVIVVMDPRTLSVIVVIHGGGDSSTGADRDRQGESRESKSLQSLHHVSAPLLLGVDLRVTFQSPCRKGRYAGEFSGSLSERRTFNPTRTYT